jgi:hypothetical protein
MYQPQCIAKDKKRGGEMTLKLRLTGPEIELREFVNWLHLAGLAPLGGQTARQGDDTAGSHRCYLQLELPAYDEQIQITTHPGDGDRHAPALALRGQAGVVAVSLGKVGELCEALSRTAAEFAAELVR